MTSATKCCVFSSRFELNDGHSTPNWLQRLLARACEIHPSEARATLASFTLVLMLMVWSNSARTAVIERWTYAVVAVAAMQVLLGAVMAYISLAPAAQILHLTVASLLLGAETVVLLVVWWEPVS